MGQFKVDNVYFDNYELVSDIFEGLGDVIAKQCAEIGWSALRNAVPDREVEEEEKEPDNEDMDGNDATTPSVSLANMLSALTIAIPQNEVLPVDESD